MSLVKTSEDVVCRCGICMNKCVFPFDGQEADISRDNFGAISSKTLSTILACEHIPRNNAVIFAGGFLDSLFCSLLTLARAYSAKNHDQDVWYATYDSNKQLLEIIRSYNQAGKAIILVGHSWGGDMAAQALAHAPDVRVNLLVTLDPVSKKGPPPKQENMGTWVNFYVNYALSRAHRANFLAQIGGPWKKAAGADLNIPQEEWGKAPQSSGQKDLAELHHADVQWMLCYEPLINLWNDILPDSRFV